MSIKHISILVFTIFLISCSDKKLIRYEFKNSDIELNSFYYSYLTNTSSDFIEVKCGNSFQTIFESKFGLQKVKVENQRIIISHLEFNGNDPKIKRTENICGYEIEYREVTSHEMYQKYIKEKELKSANDLNSNLVEFLDNPIDLLDFKKKKGMEFTTSVTNGTEYYFQPQIKDSIFYVYYYPDFKKESIKIDQFVVFKHGESKKPPLKTEALIFRLDPKGHKTH